MTTEDMAELFLVRLYDLAEAAPHPNFLFTVNDFAPTFGITDGHELQRAIDLLGDRGFIISAALDMLGGISAVITMEGSVFVEEGGETGIIGRYRADPGAFIVMEPPEPHPEAPPETEPRREAAAESGLGRPPAGSRAVEAILADMEDILAGAGGADAERDALADLAALKVQLGRTVPNGPVIGALLDGLCSMPPVAPLAAALRAILSGGRF